MLGLLKELGSKLVAQSDEIKAFIYLKWCKHFLPNKDHKIIFAIEALFPAPNLIKFEHSQLMEAEEHGLIEVHQCTNSHSEIYIRNLAEAASFLSYELADRILTGRVPFNPDASKCCCTLCSEEERRRLKQPEEILSQIKKLKGLWPRRDDPGPYYPQRLIDDLWADMKGLGWQLPKCLKLPPTHPPSLKHMDEDRSDAWREYQGALSLAEEVVSKNLGPKLPADDEFLSVADLIKAFSIPEARQKNLQRAIDRKRSSLDDQDYLEIANPTVKQPRYTYRVGAVKSTIEKYR